MNIKEKIAEGSMVHDTDFEVSSQDAEENMVVTPGPFQYAGYFIAGIFFGILLVKAEVISWFRIQEMFRLQSFHMYGVIGSAVVTGIISLLIIKKFNVKTLHGERIQVASKKFNKGQVYGGLIFGFGWALTGACPGPIFAQIGAGSTVVIITLLSALAGTWTYGYFRNSLPH